MAGVLKLGIDSVDTLNVEEAILQDVEGISNKSIVKG
jgi:hypothetical protein